MATVKTVYSGGLRTEATHVSSGAKIATDAPKDNNGKGESFSPTDLVATALGSCAMTLMGIVAQRENIDLTGVEFSTIKVMAESPRRIAEIHVDFYLPKKLNVTKEQQKLLERAAHACPVAKSLNPEVAQKLIFHW